MSTTCLQSTQLAATIFGAIAGTLLLCLLFLALLFHWARSRQWVKFDLPLLEKSSTRSTVKNNGFKGPLTTSRVHPLMARETRVTALDEMDSQKQTNKNRREAQFTVQMQPNEVQKKAANMEDDLVDVVGFSICKRSGVETSGFIIENVDTPATGKFLKGDRLVSIQIDMNKMSLEEVDTMLRSLAAVPYSLKVDRSGEDNAKTSNQPQSCFPQPNASLPINYLNNSNKTTSQFSANGSFGVVTSTPKVEEESHELTTISTATGSQPPSLPSGSPPLSYQEEEVVEVVDASSPTPVASPNTSTSPVVVRLRQKRQPLECSPSLSAKAAVDPSSPTCNIRMGFLKDQEEEVGLTIKATEMETVVHQQQPQPQSTVSTKKVELESNNSKQAKSGTSNGLKAMNKTSQKISAESEDVKDYQNIDLSANSETKQHNGKVIPGQNSILSLEQCGTLEANRKRLERERQQLRQLGII